MCARGGLRAARMLLAVERSAESARRRRAHRPNARRGLPVAAGSCRAGTRSGLACPLPRAIACPLQAAPGAGFCLLDNRLSPVSWFLFLSSPALVFDTVNSLSFPINHRSCSDSFNPWWLSSMQEAVKGGAGGFRIQPCNFNWSLHLLSPPPFFGGLCPSAFSLSCQL